MSQANPAPLRPPFRLPPLMGPVIGLLVVLMVFLILTRILGVFDLFARWDNLPVLVYTNTVVAMAALGMLLIIVSGGIDLSVGSVVALVTVVTMWVYSLVYAGPSSLLLLREWAQQIGWSWPGTQSMMLASVAAIAAGVLTGGLCGLTNGVVITAFRLPPFVATLGMMTIARGLAYALSNRVDMNFPGGDRPGWVESLSRAQDPTFYFNPGFWLLVILAIGVAVLLHRTVLGRFVFALGSNEATARLCGVPVRRTRITIYLLAGLLIGGAGVLSFAQIGSGTPGGNVGLELEVIAAVVIGGARLTGGQGSVMGTMLGVLTMGVLATGVTACEVSVEVKQILVGVIIIAMMALSHWRRR